MRSAVCLSILCAALAVPATLGAQQQPMTQADAEKLVQGNAMAELTKGINSKKAKVGDPVVVRTLKDATLSDGTTLPKGTRLTGKITAVQPESKDQPQAQVSFVLDTAEMHKGQTMPVKVLVTGAGVPNSTSLNMHGSSGGPDPGAPMAAGGAPGAPGGGPGSTAASQRAASSDAMQQNGAPSGVASGGSGQPTANSQPGSGKISVNSDGVLQITDMPVANLPGAILSSSNSGNEAVTISESGKNLSLDSGTQLRIEVMPAK